MPQDYSHRLKSLREKIFFYKAWGLIVPYSNCFQSDYMVDGDHRLAWLTGFKGSAGLAIVLDNHAALFVDGRYTLQASQEIDSRCFSVESYTLDSIKAWLEKWSASNRLLLYDPWLHTFQQVAAYKKHFDPLDIILKSCEANLIDELWDDRPVAPSHPFVPHQERWSGKSFQEKLKPFLKIMHSKNADYFVITSQESLSWLLNIRGSDAPFSPVCKVFAVISGQGQVQVFTDLKKVTDNIRSHCGDSVLWLEFTLFLEVVSSFVGKKILADFAQLPQKVFDCLKQAKAEVTNETDPCILGRAVKNKVEQEGAEAAHHRDGVAMINFLAWLARAHQQGHEPITELEAADYLLEQRRRQPYFQGASFPTISAVGPHGAIVHYHPNPLTQAVFSENSIYLIDSGGQYLDGTTDITRTLALGKPTAEQKDRFTRVLKGHIALATAIFPSGTTGQHLDVLARQYLWQIGLDYEHGTGHGVGSYLNVHEGPHRIAKQGGEAVLQPGMLVTNEPGYYKTGEYGIRIESALLIVKNERERFLSFKTLALVPIDYHLMDVALLTAEEIRWIDEYHTRVYTELSSLVDEQAKGWLKQATRPLEGHNLS